VYLRYSAMTKDAAERRSWTFYEANNFLSLKSFLQSVIYSSYRAEHFPLTALMLPSTLQAEAFMCPPPPSLPAISSTFTFPFDRRLILNRFWRLHNNMQQFQRPVLNGLYPQSLLCAPIRRLPCEASSA